MPNEVQAAGSVAHVEEAEVESQRRAVGSHQVGAPTVAVEARQQVVRRARVAEIESSVDDLDLESVPQPPARAAVGGLHHVLDHLRLEERGHVVATVMADDDRGVRPAAVRVAPPQRPAATRRPDR